MSPFTHFFLGWLAANAGGDTRRDRALIAAAGVIPDVDGLGAVVQVLSRDALPWFSDYHHLLHNIGFCLLMSAVFGLLARDKLMVVVYAALAFNIHLLSDIIGAQDPDYQWPIPYLSPFSDAWNLTWSHQWAINAWPNFVITGVALAITFYLAWKRGFSPLEIISTKADKVFVSTLRKRFPFKIAESAN